MSTTVRPKKHDKSFLARWAPVAQALSLSRYKRHSLSPSFSLSFFGPARVHRALFFPRLSTDHTIRLLSRYRPIVCRANGGMRDNCATLQNAFGAISIYPSIEDIYTSNSFSRRELLDLRDLSVSSRIRFYTNLFWLVSGVNSISAQLIELRSKSFVSSVILLVQIFYIRSCIEVDGSIARDLGWEAWHMLGGEVEDRGKINCHLVLRTRKTIA